MSKSRDQLNDFLKQINIEGKIVLDIGVQDKPNSRLCQGKPLAYYTTDIDPQWPADFIFDLNDPIAVDMFHNKPEKKAFDQFQAGFDVIFCTEVLEHCWNPVQVVQNLSSLCASGVTGLSESVVYISTPLINPHHDYVDYLRYTNEWYRDVLPKVGFDSVTIHERTATAGKGLLEAFFKTEGMRVSKIRPEYGKYTYPIGYFIEARRGTK